MALVVERKDVFWSEISSHFSTKTMGNVQKPFFSHHKKQTLYLSQNWRVRPDIWWGVSTSSLLSVTVLASVSHENLSWRTDCSFVFFILQKTGVVKFKVKICIKKLRPCAARGAELR